MKIKLTKWARRNIYELLNAQRMGRAPLRLVADMIELRAKIDPTDLDAEDEKKYTLTISDDQFNMLYDVCTNDQIKWPANELAVAFHEEINQLKESLNESS